jgi:ABC-type sugar transport system substrate-binding protein
MDASDGLSRPAARLFLVALAAATGFAVAGCGSSKPAYCDPIGKLKTSVSNLNVSEGVSGLETQISKIADDAHSAVSSAKSDFSGQTSAIDTAIAKLRDDLANVKSTPSASTLTTLASAAGGVVSSVDDLVSATKSKCQ